jgi:hypothetical protein
MTYSVLGIDTNQIHEIDPRTGRQRTYYLPKINPQTGKEERIRLAQVARRQGTYLIGAIGTGKSSSVILNLGLQDIKQGKGIAVLDPHSDLINSFLSQLEEKDLERVVLLDPLDETHVFGLNLYSCADPTNDVLVQQTYEQVEHIFDVLWHEEGEEQFGPQVREGLLYSTYALIYNSGTEYTGCGMLEIPLLFQEGTPRANMVKHIQDPLIRSYWENKYEPFDRYEKARRADMVINKLNEFIANPIFRRIVGQGTTTIDFTDVMDNGKILLVKLPGRFERMAQILGAMVIAQLLGASYARESQHKRPQFNIYADEYQRFATRDFAKLLTEASRKYNTPVTIAHQARDFIDLKNKAASLQVANLIVLRVIRKDADEIAGNFDCTPIRTKKVLKRRTRPVFKEWDETVWIEDGEARFKEAEAEYEARRDELTQRLTAAEKREQDAVARRDGAYEAHKILKLAFTGEQYGLVWPHREFDEMSFQDVLYWEGRGLMKWNEDEKQAIERVNKEGKWRSDQPSMPSNAVQHLSFVREHRRHLQAAYPEYLYLPFHPAWYCYTWGGDRWASSRSYWLEDRSWTELEKGKGWTDEKVENTIVGLLEVKSRSVADSFEYLYDTDFFGRKTQRVDYTYVKREERYAVSETTLTGLQVVLQEQMQVASAAARRILSELYDELSEIVKPVLRQGIWFQPKLEPSPCTGFVSIMGYTPGKMRSKEVGDMLTGWPLLAKHPQPAIGEKRTLKGWVRHGNWYIQAFPHILTWLRKRDKALQELCQQRENELSECQKEVSSIKQQLNQLKAKDQEIKQKIKTDYQITEHHKEYLGEQPEVETRTRISQSHSQGSSVTESLSWPGRNESHGRSSSHSTSYSPYDVQWYDLVDELDQTHAQRQDEIANEIASLPDYVARVRIKDENDEFVEYTIRTLAPERGLPEKALIERIARIKETMIGNKTIRPKHEIDKEIRIRQQALRHPQLEPPHKQGMLPPPEDEPPITRRR